MKNPFYIGAKGQLILQLQQYLNCKGWHIAMDGIFGTGTQHAFTEFLIKEGYAVSDVCVNIPALISAPSKIDAWCLSIKSEEGFIAPGQNSQYPNGTPAWKNNNPGNLEFAHQLNAVPNGRFAKFATYQDGYNALKSMLILACTGQSSNYKPDETLFEFYAGIPIPNRYNKNIEGYSPASDGNDPVQYSKKVASDVGVDWSSTTISQLLPV